MATGKTLMLGGLMINFSDRGIAAKRAESDQIWRLPFPWAKRRYENAYGRMRRGSGGDRYDYDDPRDSGDSRLDSTGLMWLALILLPPLGIWMIWRRNRFDFVIRAAVSLSSFVWMIVILVMLFSGGSGDTAIKVYSTNPPELAPTQTQSLLATPEANPGATPEATANAGLLSFATDPPDRTAEAGEPLETPTGDPQFLSVAGLDATPSPSPTPAPQKVWSNPGGRYYHARSDCSGMRSAEYVELAVALNRGQTPCASCMGGSPDGGGGGGAAPVNLSAPTYYATATGQYYHTDSKCKGMKNAAKVLPATAVKRKQSACPVCVKNAYANPNGKSYHATPGCSGMTGAVRVTVASAKASGKSACSVCIGKATGGPTGTTAASYYSTANGKYYHAKQFCSGMRGATKITLSAAQAKKQTPCPVCIKNAPPGVSYYATADGKYYHIKATCSGMRNAVKVTLSAAQKKKQTACPICLKGPATIGVTTATKYYATTNGKFYHKTATCGGMKGAVAVDLATALKRKQTPCPTCLGSVASYYATRTGQYYHKTATCSGMRNATKISASTAKKNGQTACPTCLGGAVKPKTTPPPGAKVYYGTPNGKYYHAKARCSGMLGAVKISLSTAEGRNQKPCPVCIKPASPTPTNPPGAKNKDIKVFVTIEGSKYHSIRTCSGMQHATQTNLEWALARNFTRCTVCNAPRPVS